MYTRESFKFIGPVRKVESTFCELKLEGEATVEIRIRPSDCHLFDSEGRLLEEISSERELVDFVYRDVYLYDVDGKLIEAEEYDRDERLIGKAHFGTNDKGNRVKDNYYVAESGQLLLESRLTWEADDRTERIYFDKNGKVVKTRKGSDFPIARSEFSKTIADDGYSIEERRVKHDKLITRLVTRYDTRGNELDYSLYDHEIDGEMYIKQEYYYEFDSVGNWITQTVFRWVVGWGPFRMFPYTRTRRTIEYF